MKKLLYIAMMIAIVMFTVAGCSTQKNDAKSRWWHSFTARYNTYYNGSQAFIEGSIEKENANKDNFTELIPLYIVANKNSKSTGLMKFDRAIEKSEKAIKQHSIKKRPEWTKNRRKTAEDIEWLNRKEYNPFLWKAWLLLGKSQFQKGNFDEAAATFSYMSRLYSTQPAINGIARAWLAKSYVELDWLYDAEDVMTKMLRDTIHYRAQKDWDYTIADYYIKSGQLQQAVPYLHKVIKHEKRKKLKARQWYLMGQIQYALGNGPEAYKAYRKVVSQHPPYELEFNAHIAQTEVMAGGRSKQMISKLKRMARSDNNKDYLDQVYYAMGNIYLLRGDTANAIGAYEKGNKESTRNGIEKGVLLLKLGGLYWEKEKYNDAQRCYGEAIGLLDKERPDYEELSNRSKVLDELVPHTDAVYLQDSLLVLADLPEEERNKAIDRVIEELKKKEKEEKNAAQEAEAEKVLQRQGATGNRNNMPNRTPGANQQQGGAWYFYNPMAVNQGKTAFQRQWGKRENTDDWRRMNRTVVNLQAEEGSTEMSDSLAITDSLAVDDIANDSTAVDTAADSLANDPHNREYYLAQIPFTDEQKAASNEIIMEGLFNSGVIFKDKLENLKLGEKALARLTTQYPTYAKTDEAWYHLFLLYSRQGIEAKADSCLEKLKADFPESDFTILLSDPFFVENARFGVHLEDSLYAATYEAFRKDRYQEIKANAKISRERFPLGANRAKFIFIEGLGMLNDGDATSCLANMKEVVEKYPQSEVSEMAGMIIKGVQEGRKLHGGKFDLGDIWSRRSMTVEIADSTIADTLSAERNATYVFMLAFSADSVNSNQLLYDMAKYNFTNFMVRNFDIEIDEDKGISRMLISGFLSYDEALQYARQLYSDAEMPEKLKGCKRIIVSEDNLKLLGTKYSYEEYDRFFEQALAPLHISEEQLLTIPETVETAKEPQTEDEAAGQNSGDDLFMEDADNKPVEDGFDFEEDFYR